MKVWKPTQKDLTLIRKYAKKVAREGRVIVEAGLRYDNSQNSFNVLVFGGTPTEAWDNSDLSDFAPLNSLKGMEIELTPSGEAEVDFYVSEVHGRNWVQGCLILNVQAHVKLNGKGKPYIYKMTGTLEAPEFYEA